MPQEMLLMLLDKYLAGNCTDDERIRVEDWINQVSRDRDEWSSMPPEQQQKFLQALYAQVIHQVQAPHETPPAITTTFTQPRPQRTWRMWTAAACIISLMAVGGILYKHKSSTSSQAIPPRVAWITQSTRTGQIKQLTLPDSTHVWLNASSSILYQKGFSQATREVFLNGEAFFDVAKDQDKPFIIHTQDMQTRVLGTRFNISGYTSDSDFNIAVLSGKIEVSTPGKSHAPKTLVQANQLVTYTKRDGKFDKKDIADASGYADWRTGKLAFHHTEMQVVIRKLRHIYGIQITIRGQAIRESRISGHFNVQQPPAEVIRSICLSIGAKYKMQGSRVTITEDK